MSNIQVLRPKYHVDECLAAIKECLDTGWTGLGGKTVEFEKAWCEYTKLPHSHFLNSATAGLHLAIKLLKDAGHWTEDIDEVITTPLTFVSTNHAIMYERLVPVFADIDPNTLCLSPESVERAISSRTRAIIYVGLGGRYGHLDEISKICKKRGLKLILDAAHMAGTRRWNRHIGPEADVTVFSFQSVKNLPTADGGMICFQDAELDARARKMSWLGIDKDTFSRSTSQGTYKWKYDVPYVGYKYHGNSIMAAIGLVQLKYLDEDNQYRRQIAALYDKMLNPKILRPKDVNGVQCSQHLYQIIVDDRDRILEQLNIQGIYPGVHYIDNTKYPIYRSAFNEDDTLSLQLSEKLLTLPIHLHMTDADVNKVIDTINGLIK